MAELFSSNNPSTLEAYQFDATTILDFIHSYRLSQYSFETLKTFACHLNGHKEFLDVLHRFFQKTAADGCPELVAYMLKECDNLNLDYDDLNLYEKIFLAYKKHQIKLDRQYTKNSDDLKEKLKKLSSCVELLLKDPRININNYAFIMACLTNQPIAVHCLLDNRHIEINCLALKIDNNHDPLNFYNYQDNKSLIGWIEREHGEIINILLKQRKFLKQNLLVDIFCSQLNTALSKKDSNAAINLLKELTAFGADIFTNSGFLWGLLAQLDGESTMCQAIFSYMLEDQTFDWFREFEQLNELEELFSDSPKLVIDLAKTLINDRKFHPFIYNSVKICCFQSDDPSAFEWVCKNIEKLDADTVYSEIVLYLVENLDFEESSKIKNLWLSTSAFKKAKILLESTVEQPENPHAFFTLPEKAVHLVMQNFIKLEEEALENDLEAASQYKA